jgi:hypothetical protein
MSDPTDDLLRGVPSFAAWSGLPESTVRLLIREKKLPVIRFTDDGDPRYTKVYIRRSSYLRLLDQMEAESMRPAENGNGAPEPEPPEKRPTRPRRSKPAKTGSRDAALAS